MKKENIILIIEPDRIIGWDLQLQLESNGYNVFQAQSIKLVEEFKNKHLVKLIIVAFDKIVPEEFAKIKEAYFSNEVTFIGIGSSQKKIPAFDGINFSKTFAKPFDTKNVVLYIDKTFSVREFK